MNNLDYTIVINRICQWLPVLGAAFAYLILESHKRLAYSLWLPANLALMIMNWGDWPQVGFFVYFSAVTMWQLWRLRAR